MPSRARRNLALLSLIGSGGLVVSLFAAFLAYNSQLAFAQAADSFMDVFTAGVIMWTVVIAAKPEDEDHPFGHSRAEPIGGLVTAVVAGILAIEVGRSAIDALLEREPLRLAPWLLVLFIGKGVFKVLVMVAAGRLHKRNGSPGMKALKVDARNDVLVSLLAITGYGLAQQGWHAADAWLALPVAVWIAWAGFGLARDNIKLLMGEAPPEERRLELKAIASACQGVERVRDVRAQFLGTELQVAMDVIVKPDLSVQQGHDIGEAVKVRIEEETDVGQCLVHVDTE